jgi:hypothetical protein
VGPMTPRVVLANVEFERGLFGEVAFGNAANLDLQLERLGCGDIGFPFDLKDEAGAFGGFFAKLGLIGVAVIKAGSEGGAAFEVEKLREDLEDAALACAGGRGEKQKR